MTNNCFQKLIPSCDRITRDGAPILRPETPVTSSGRRTVDKSVRILHNRYAVRPCGPKRCRRLSVLGGCYSLADTKPGVRGSIVRLTVAVSPNNSIIFIIMTITSYTWPAWAVVPAKETVRLSSVPHVQQTNKSSSK